MAFNTCWHTAWDGTWNWEYPCFTPVLQHGIPAFEPWPGGVLPGSWQTAAVFDNTAEWLASCPLRQRRALCHRHVVVGRSHWHQEEDWSWRNRFGWISSLCYWCRPLFPSWIPVFKGRFDSSPKTFPSLFHSDTRRGSDPQVYHAPFQAQRLVVLSSLDVVYILDLTPYPRWNSSWLVDLSIWKNLSFAFLALCNNDIIFTSHLFICHVFNRDQTNDVFKTWNSYRCLR